MAKEYDFFKMMHGKTIDEVGREVPSADDTIDRIMKQLKSNYSLRLLGTGLDGHIYISEEERYLNFHILGAPGEGKSKFLEYNIRKDIKMGNGLCLIDPSEKGDTARNILNYCAAINYKKVILIDPTLISEYKKVPCIAPLKAKSMKSSIEGVMEALAILFKTDYSTMRRIRRYLAAILRILTSQNLTLKEARYFSDYHLDLPERAAILGDDRDSSAIRNLFRSETKYDNFFSSTVNMLDAFWQEPLASILGNTEGIDFKRAVADGWVILVNLSPYELTEDEAELLGIIIISQVIQAVDSLVNNHWKGVYYLYIDEVGSFATPQIALLLDKKRKSGLRLYLAHHHFDQFEGRKKVLSSIENNARIKLMFDTPRYEDRMQMVKALGYGGDIPPVVAHYANQNIPKQHAVLRKNKETPVRIRIPDVKPVPDASKEYIKSILSQSFYKDVQSIRANIKNTKLRKVDDGKPNNPPDVPAGILAREQQQSISKGHEKPQDTKGQRKTLKI